MRAWDSGARAHPHRSHMAEEAVATVEAVVGMGMVKASVVAVILLVGAWRLAGRPRNRGLETL